jgi:hypothetical protein
MVLRDKKNNHHIIVPDNFRLIFFKLSINYYIFTLIVGIPTNRFKNVHKILTLIHIANGLIGIKVKNLIMEK